MRNFIILILAAFTITACGELEEKPEVEGTFEVGCGPDGYYEVWYTEGETTYRPAWDRGYCPEGTQCVPGVDKSTPCE